MTLSLFAHQLLAPWMRKRLNRGEDERRRLSLGQWSLRSLRTRLIVIVLAIDLIAGALTGFVVIWEGRRATRLEINSAMAVAETIVSDTISLMQDAPSSILLQSVELQLQAARHVRVSVTDGSDRPIVSASSKSRVASDPDRPPAWFVTLASPRIKRKSFPVVVHGHKVGTVLVFSAPEDELVEAWTYVHALLIAAAAINLLVVITLFAALGRLLSPLTSLVIGLRRFEKEDYAIRLQGSSILELGLIVGHFNTAANALSKAQEENRNLRRKILTAQDDERRRTALELHDEVGPCLFALEANATSIATLTSSEPDLSRIHKRAIDVVALVERVQGINRRVLDRLRPMALGQLRLCDSLTKLVMEADAGQDYLCIDHAIDVAASYGPLVDLTIYRCVQEGLLNAVRHARAGKIKMSVTDQAGGVAILIRDDGIGLPDVIQGGFGLSGMRERVEALDGHFLVEKGHPGTRLDIFIPLTPLTSEALEQMR